jgi:putative radical SAM enzyme (TIGR03279 family)
MKITEVEPGSIAAEAGLRPGDELLEINAHSMHDSIDLRFHEIDADLMLKVSRSGEVILFDIEKDDGERLGIEIEEMKVLCCGNDCIFCFVDQNPKGLRRELYIRDGDYRLSFLYGNYTTMTSAGPAILRRIIDQRLSPQYISVHVTDYEVRKHLMGLKKDDKILEKIALLHDNGIAMHTQIVLCPGINDGDVLRRTVFDLYKYQKQIHSLAIVPVGLTGHRMNLHTLRKVDPVCARTLLETVEVWQKQFRREISRGFVYPSDEFFILAGRPIPPARYYDGFPQVENGVGLVRSFLRDFTRQARSFPKRLSGRRKLALATGELAGPFMRNEIVRRLKKIQGLDVKLTVVPNLLYGRSVTVAGLLSGKCLYSALKDEADLLLLPPDIVNADGLMLDDMRVPELEAKLRMPVMVYNGRWADVFSKLKRKGTS